ncbi:chitin disaccharide deacetylase [Vibrio vulnificus]|uniref:chitin disaccharide deacetylase n=1 Tax=Vibrio vulnificus TaxID=672 RepID=UPI0019D4ED39|nr:chitin disaccharide deacetylase [Vibrio vulnificus]MBN8132517.1 chitin disaccharide deacetylase [Vibrio vulnificus]MBN8159869.1 chitin disaccharide deacetylase [Vibrio vulnificus]
MKVIFNADDFGLTRGVNDGIVHAHLDGVVRSTTMMVGMPAEAHAVELANHLPELKVGLHLRFTAGRPLTEGQNLVGRDGDFTPYGQFWHRRDYDPIAIHNEAVAQVEYFLALGLNLSHIDSHHHAHTHPQFEPVIYDIARTYQVPLRSTGLAGEAEFGCRYHFTDHFYDKRVGHDSLIQHLLTLKEHYDVVEVMCHPAIVDTALEACSGYAKQRELELAILTSDELKLSLRKHDIEVTDYSELIFAPLHSCV